jgi:hypothetical protein
VWCPLFGVNLKMHNTLIMLSIVFGVAASLFGIWAALSEVRDSQDDFIADLKKQGRRAGIAAMCAAASSIILALDFFGAARWMEIGG